MKKTLLSKIALYICLVVVLYEGVFFYPKWKNGGTEAAICWDVSGYYMYLPAIFIYGDLKHCGFKDKILHDYQPTPDFQQAFLHPSGNYVMKYSSGQALLFSPFFFAAHLFAKVSDAYPADGFSYPYQLAVGLAALFYCIIGLWMLRKILLRFFSDAAVAVTLLTIVVASNYLEYAAIGGGMTHNTLFTVYCSIVLATIGFYSRPTLLKALLVGGLCGLATLIRPTEIISVLIPVFWGVATSASLKERFFFFLRKARYLLLAGIGFVLFVSIQLIYWKYVSGDWLVYSYQGQGFSWLSPHFYVCTLSYRTGWLVYSPAMAFALLGFVFLFQRHRTLFPAVLLFSLLFMYINFAWDEWWYGGALGQRCMVQAYALLAFPLASLYEVIYRKRNFLMFLLTPVLLLCGYYNLWLTYQAHKGTMYHAGYMTKAYFWATVGRLEADVRTLELLDTEDLYLGNPKKFTVLYTNDFETDTSDYIITDNAIKGKSAFITKDKQYTPAFSFALPNPATAWIRIGADVRLTSKEWDIWKMPQLVYKIYQNDWMVQSGYIRVNRMIPKDGDTRYICMDVKLPSTMLSRCEVYFWNANSDKEVIVDNLQVIGFDPENQ